MKLITYQYLQLHYIVQTMLCSVSLTSELVFGVDVRVYEQEVIVVPVLLLASFLGTLILVLLLRFCPERVDRIRAKTRGKGQRSRRNLHGIDGEYRGNLVRSQEI